VTDAVSLIRAKRDGQRLADDDIRWLFEAYARHEVADEQMSALLMAIYFRGLDRAELRTWTAAMIASGDRLDLSSVGRPTVDKHSTGGVGDKVSLILAPLVAACGAAVPQLSGRGLGHTGGTLDKLESIPGFRTGLTPEETLAVLASAGCVICAAGSGLAPADRRLYALRDVTGTVESIPLIASSIMSKKIAEGTGALVLDVKVGTGAFMTSYQRARELAETMVALGEEHGVRTRALLTRMDVPLGRAVGNAVEVEESVQALHGDGPADLMEVTLALARQMLALAGLDADPAAAIADGRALAAYRAMVRAQGGDPDAPLPQAAYTQVLPAPASGWLTSLDALKVGIAAWRLGAGRARKEDDVSASAGIICLAKPGDRVQAGQPLLELRADEQERFGPARAALEGAAAVGDQAPPPVSPVIEEVLAPGDAPQTPAHGGLPAARIPREQNREMPTLAEIRAVPKVLLHDHLDGGLRPETVLELARETGYNGLPADNVQELTQRLTEGAHRGHLEIYLDAFRHTVAVMQTPEALRRVAAECAEDLAADGIVYAEVRFAPELHTERGLTLDEVVEAVLDGFRQGSASQAVQGRGITVYALLTAMRTAARSLEIAELAVRYRDRGVVGFDIAGAEAGWPPSRHLDAFQYIKRENFHITIHAGEGFGLPSIWEAVQWCGTERLGHGVRIVDDIQISREGNVRLGRLAAYVRDRRIPLEMCPTSNVQTGAAPSIALHPIRLLRQLSFRVTVNTDNRLMSQVTLSSEFHRLAEEFGYGWTDIEWLTINAMKSAFAGFDERLHLINTVIKPGFATARAVSGAVVPVSMLGAPPPE
jgi:thymidine phosphorylase